MIMNKNRRKAIAEVRDILESANSNLEVIRDEEQESFDNLPEGIQASERGERMYECIECLEAAIDNLSEAIDNLDESNYD